MGELIYLVKVKTDIHGNFVPENYDHCPRHQHDGAKYPCFDGKNYCMAIDDHCKYKELDNMKGLLQCNYWVD